MANNPTGAQTNLILESLNLEKASNYSRLEYYLKQIIAGRDVVFLTRADNPITLSAKEAWKIIATWSQGEGALPVGDRDPKFNIRSRATHLLNYLETNISGKTAEAAANYRLMLEQAKYSAPPSAQAPTSTQDANLKKAFELRRKQIEMLENKFLKPLTTRLEQSSFLKDLPDAQTRSMVIQMIAASNINFRHVPDNQLQNFTAQKIHQLLLHEPGIRDVNSVMRILYSGSAPDDFKDLPITINDAIYATYKNDDDGYQKDMSTLRSLSGLSPNLDSISYLVDNLNIGSSREENQALIRAIRTQIVAAASGEHQRGETILRSALVAAGFSEISVDHFQSIAPYVEEMQVKQRHLLLGSTLSDRDSRLLGTAGLAAELGVDLTTPWIKKSTLDKITTKATGGLSLQEAFDQEFAKGDSASPQKLSEYLNLMSRHADYTHYRQSVDGSFGYQFQELWSKSLGNYLAIKEPVDRFTQKVWGGIDSIDDIVRGPQRKLAEWWEQTVENHPWLNPGALIANKWVEYQSGIAIKIHGWAINATTSNAWFKSFARNIADYTEGFVKHEANWGGAGMFFSQRKIGNVLDWSAKTFTKHQTFSALRMSVAKTAWAGFAKIAPTLSAKMIASGLSKVIIGVIAGEMTMGVSLVLQIGWEVLKLGFDFIKKILTDTNFRERFINRIPLLIGAGVAIGITFTAGLPLAIVAAAGVAGAAILALLQAAIMSLVGLFAMAGAVSLGAVAFVSLLWFGMIAPTFHLDSNTNLDELLTPSSTTVDCFKFIEDGRPFPKNDPVTGSEPTEGWTAGEIEIMTVAITTMKSSYGKFIEAVCKGGDINLWRDSTAPTVTWGGWTMSGSDIRIYNNGVSSPLYTLSHELGHIYAVRAGGLVEFISQQFVFWNPASQKCERNIYPANPTSEGQCYGENFAEGISWRVTGKGLPGSWSQWILSNIFGGS